MSSNQGRESDSVDPLAKGVGGDEVAGDERSERAGASRKRTFSARGAPRRTARTVSPEAARIAAFTGEQRLLLLDAWLRSKLPATEFAALVSMSRVRRD